METSYVNRFGRRQGRGIRPWLLLPKVVAVGLYLGGLGAALVVWLTGDLASLDKGDPRRVWIINEVAGLMVWLVVPSVHCAMVLGVGLLLQHARQLLRMRWLVVKLASLAVLLPAAHWFCASRLASLRQAATAHTANDGAAAQFAWGSVLALAGSLWIVVLGRLKPRLGQNWARSYHASMTSDQAPAGGRGP
jgi:hypothetical protein